MQFLGTAAAQLTPCPFCACDNCKKLRSLGIKKRRSCFYIDRSTMIDFGPDALAAAQDFNTDLTNLKRVFITHSHADHFSITNLLSIGMSATKPETPIDVYLSKEAFDWTVSSMIYHDPFAQMTVKEAGMSVNGFYEFRPVKAGDVIEVDGMRVLALPTHHSGNTPQETALNYFFTFSDGKKFLYASDTGMYDDADFSLLKGVCFDQIVMENTFGSNIKPEATHHLDNEHFLEQLGNFAVHGLIDGHTQIYITHVNPSHSMTPDDMQAYFDQSPYHVTVAYDGMEI